MDSFAEASEDGFAATAWLIADANLLDSGDDWWLVACMDWPRDRWIGFVQGYWKAAEAIADRVATTGRGQDYLVYPFLMCWRHYVELQLKVLVLLAAKYLRKSVDLPRTHKIDHLWRVTRTLLEQTWPGEPASDLDKIERVLLQLNGFDPTSEHFRYPILKDGSETLTSVGRVHMRRFHEVMDGVAGLLDGADTGIRVLIDQRVDYEEAMRDLYGIPEEYL